MLAPAEYETLYARTLQLTVPGQKAEFRSNWTENWEQVPPFDQRNQSFEEWGEY